MTPVMLRRPVLSSNKLDGSGVTPVLDEIGVKVPVNAASGNASDAPYPSSKQNDSRNLGLC